MHLANASACLKSLLMSLPPPPALLPLVVAVALPPRLATPLDLPPPPPQAATASASTSSRPGTSPTLMRVIAVLLAGRSGSLVVPCRFLLVGLEWAPRRCGAAVQV
jgi:hypothetical protein